LREALATETRRPTLGPVDAVTPRTSNTICQTFAATLPLRTMPICIECRYPVSSLYTTYSKADDRTLGKGVRLTQCPRCKRFADKYVEHDFVVLFIDLVLIKPQVGYRDIIPLCLSIPPSNHFTFPASSVLTQHQYSKHFLPLFGTSGDTFGQFQY